MTDYQFDLLVIGGGSGGLASSKRAASYGARVGLVEGSRVGGTCVIRGCIPKKLMVYAGHAVEWLELAEDFGFSRGDAELSWSALAEMRNGVVRRLEETHERSVRAAGVELVRGHARFIDRHHVDVDGRVVSAERFIIATGSTPVMPVLAGDGSSMSSDALFELATRPKSAAVIGGGYIAVEYAGILNSLGCEVTMLVRDQLLRDFDRELSQSLVDALEQQGIRLCQPADVEDVHRRGNGYEVRYRLGGQMLRLDVEATVVFAIGRRPNTDGLGLDNVPVELSDQGAILVDDEHRSSEQNIFAVGDVTGRANLTPVAIRAGRTVADRVFGGKDVSMSYDTIPTAVFSAPPIGTVGLTEEQARERFDEVEIYRARFVPLTYAASPEERKLRSFMKMVVDRASGRVLGLHMLGVEAPEIIQGFAVAVQAGLTKADFDATVAIHPTQAEEFVLMRAQS